MGEPSGPAEPGQGKAGTWDDVKREKKRADNWIAFGLPLAAPLLTTVVAPDLLKQTSLWGVFFATLAWSLGCMLAVWVYRAKPLGELAGIPLVIAVVVCLAVGAAVAAAIGHGAYGLGTLEEARGKTGSSPTGTLFAFMYAAVLTFGPVGAVFGAAAGIWAGYAAARLTGGST